MSGNKSSLSPLAGMISIDGAWELAKKHLDPRHQDLMPNLERGSFAKMIDEEKYFASIDKEYGDRKAAMLMRIIDAMIDGKIYALCRHPLSDRWFTILPGEWKNFRRPTKSLLRLRSLDDVGKFVVGASGAQLCPEGAEVVVPKAVFNEWLSQQPRRGHVSSMLQDDLVEALIGLDRAGLIAPSLSKVECLRKAQAVLEEPVGQNAAKAAWTTFRQSVGKGRYGKAGRKPG